jgi:hypothetical protein
VAETIPGLLLGSAQAAPERPALAWVENGAYVAIAYRELLARVR